MTLRTALKRLADRARTWPARLMAAAIPYASGAPALLWLARRHRLFGKQSRWIEQTRRELQIEDDPDQLLTHSLAANMLRFYRMAALARCRPQQFEQWLDIDGLDIVERALAQGQGVIVLNSHTSLAHLLSLILHRSGFADLHTVGDDSMKLHLFGVEPGARQAAAFADKDSGFLQQLQTAKLILRRGGLVQIAGDGSYGSSGVDAEFFGRKRFFRSGFAELAATTHAEIIPTLVTMRPNGVIRVEFEQALDRGDGKRPHRVLVDDLMNQYIQLNRRIWQEHLGDLKWRQLQRFLALPHWQGQGSS